MATPLKPNLGLFEAHGVELEYMVVSKDTLKIMPITDQLFFKLAGAMTMEVDRGPLSLNNELALHVLEIKTSDPAPQLAPLPLLFQEEITRLNQELASFEAMLMPTAMHPWMDPAAEFKIWPHGDAEIYDRLHRIFDCRGHGWSNLQSVHLNLPFGDEAQFCRLHAAIRMILPLIPSLAASSPYADGKYTQMKDFRVSTYRNNAKKIFSVTAHVIPEAVNSIAQYHDLILEPLYRDLEPEDPEGILRYEWVNARGAITRFDRNAIEIRLIDIQEAPLMDCAIAWMLTEAIKLLSEERWGSIKAYNALASERLRSVLDKTQVEAEDAIIDDRDYLELLGWASDQAPQASVLWESFLDHLPPPPPEFKEPLALLLSKGTLATRIIAHAGTDPTREALRATYRELCRCLEKGKVFVA